MRIPLFPASPPGSRPLNPFYLLSLSFNLRMPDWSNCGQIKVLYAAAFLSLGAKVKLPQRNPRVLVAFEVKDVYMKFVLGLDLIFDCIYVSKWFVRVLKNTLIMSCNFII